MIERMTPYVAQNYAPIPETGCWIWLGSWSGAGYGKLGIGGKKVILAHRLFYTFYKGEIPKGMHVCHKCDTRPCINPDHMFLGTDLDNTIDKERKNRGRWKDYIPKMKRRAKYKIYPDEQP